MERLELIGCKLEDYEKYYEIRSSQGDVYWNGYLEKPEKNNFRRIYQTRIASSPFEEDEDRRNYFIRIISNQTYTDVGFVQLIKHSDSVEIGYSVVEKYQGNRYATRALGQAIMLAKQYDKNVIVRIRDDNIASQKVAENNGFRRTNDFEVKKYPNIDYEVNLRTYTLC